jgi:hypothetical protein
MTTLGELMATVGNPLEVAAMMVEVREIPLLVRIDNAAEAAATDRAAIAREAVRAFTDAADNEAWVKLMGRVQDAPFPGAACLAEMIGWWLAAHEPRHSCDAHRDAVHEPLPVSG